MHSALLRSTFLRVFKFLQIKDGGPNFWGHQFCRKWIIWSWSSLLYFNFNHAPKFIVIDYVSMHSAWFRSTFLRVLKFLEIKVGNVISGGNQFCKKSELFGPPFSISILKFRGIQIHCHSLDFNAFCMIQEYFSKSLEISTN